MAQSNKVCPHCKKLGHSGFYCPDKPKAPIKRTPIKKSKVHEIVLIKKPRKKSTPRALAKKKAWDAFSMYIRTRDCLRFTGEPDVGKCVTCKDIKPRTLLQAGHFVGGRGNAVLFNEQIVYSQCFFCNQKPPMGLGGNYQNYTLFMFDEGYTRDEIEGFLALKGTTNQYKLNDFIEIEAKYKQKLEDLLS